MPGLMPDIVIVDDHVVVAQSIASALESHAGIRTLGVASTLDELRALLRDCRPRVIVADIHLEHDTGLDVLELPQVRDDKIPVLFLSSYDRVAAMTPEQRALTSGYLLKSTSIETLADAIRIISNGNRIFDSHLRPNRASAVPAPTGREIELLEALAQGKTNVQVGHALGISSRTVESHLRRLFSRYGVASRSHLLMLAIRRGWISAGLAEVDKPD
jgi:DNA-binding NarL/FixJ family response regulator